MLRYPRLAARLGALAGLLALAACDSQAPPPRTNPFDPGFAGSAIATGPADLALAAATATTATLSWTDRSSFETGVRVELLGRFGQYEPLATLPPDATRYTDTGLTDTAPRTYRVVALTGGGGASAPSAPLSIRYPADTLSLGTLDPSSALISPDGERLYTRDADETRITSLRTGTSLGRIPRPPQIIAFLADGRLAFRETTPQASTLGIRFFDGTAQGALATLRFPSPEPPLTFGGCFGIGGSTAVSADGRHVADICGAEAALVWTLPSETPVRVVLPYSQNGQSRRLALSPDGTRLFAETPSGGTSRLSAFDLATGALVWEIRDVQRPAYEVGLGLSPDGTVLAVVAGGRLRIVDPASGAVRVEVAGPYGGVAAVSATEILVTGYDVALRASFAIVLRASDLSLVRTLSADQGRLVRLVPGGAVAVALSGGRAVAVRQSFTGVWEAAGR